MVAASDTRRKRVSKKNKKSWRKNTDTSDVDAYLDNVRIEERLGGPVSAKSDAQLFHIDTVARKKGTNVENLLLSKRERRKVIKPLRCLESLKNDSCVSDPKVKRNLPRKPVKISHARKVQEQIRTLRKDTMAIQDRARDEERRNDAKKVAHIADKDLWEEDDPRDQLPVDSTWLRPQTLVHTVQHVTKKIGKKPKTSLKKNSVLPAIEDPHPGESYNPSLKDHQDLLAKVAEHEMELIKKEKHLERVTTKMYGKPSERPTEATRLKEMSEGLPFITPDGDAADAVSEGSDSEFRALNPPVQNKKKTLQKRRHLMEAHRGQLEMKEKKIEKKKIADIYKLKKLVDEIAEEKAEQARLNALHKEMLKRKALLTKRMSHYKFEEAELDFNMPGDLRGTVRSLKTEGSLLRDRFKSMQKRNVIETRIKQKRKRKYKLKKITKKSHKMDEV